MSLKVQHECSKIKAEAENLENQVYSDNLEFLTKGVKGLYRELQERLEPGKAGKVFPYEGVIPKFIDGVNFNKDGVEIENGQRISGGEYVERQVKNQETGYKKYLTLMSLTGQVSVLEQKLGIKLTGKYLPKELREKIYRPGLTKKQMKSTVEVLEEHLKNTEKIVPVFPHEEERRGSSALNSIDVLVRYQIKNVHNTLTVLKKELDKE